MFCFIGLFFLVVLKLVKVEESNLVWFANGQKNKCNEQEATAIGKPNY